MSDAPVTAGCRQVMDPSSPGLGACMSLRLTAVRGAGNKVGGGNGRRLLGRKDRDASLIRLRRSHQFIGEKLPNGCTKLETWTTMATTGGEITNK